MIIFPCCKINLGLNIVGVRPNGYHDIETVFFPVPLYDALEIVEMDEQFPSLAACDLKVTGNAVDCDEQSNLVVKAYQLMQASYKVPRVHIHLFKNIPSQAGMGGGSADAAFTLRLLNQQFKVGLSEDELRLMAVKLGADCPFFIRNEAAYATGIGEELAPLERVNGKSLLAGYWLGIVKPDICVSTAEAYAGVAVEKTIRSCREIVYQDIDSWRTELSNSFEPSVYACYPRLGEIKKKLYDMGAIYAQMSGSGSAHFGIFHNEPKELARQFPSYFTFSCKLE